MTAQFRALLPTPAGSSGEIVRSATAQFETPPEKLLNSLSYTHFEQMVVIADPLKRTFYEVECIRGQWSVRELKRQIASLYFERSALSKDKDALAARRSGRERITTAPTVITISHEGAAAQPAPARRGDTR